jgi:hypothetical protein
MCTAQNNLQMTINQNAPVVQTSEILIHAEPAVIWKFLTSINQWDQWNNRISTTQIEEEPAVGVNFSWKNNGTKINSKIHTYNSYETLGWTGNTWGVKAIHNWHLSTTESGTLVQVEESMEGLIINLFKNKINETLQDDMQFWLGQLKLQCEKD